MIQCADDKEETKEEYLAIFAIFEKFLREHGNEKEQWILLEEMMALRAEFAIHHAIKGFGMDVDEALEILSNHNDGLSKQEKEQRDILVAAITNLIDFAVCEEFQMYDDLPEYPEDGVEQDELDYYEECEDLCHTYNDIYAFIENGDIAHAMAMAAWWTAKSENTLITYMTQGDNRVRPWHAALEGLSYPKKEFPGWLVPPIEHGCRCFLVEESAGVFNSADILDVEAAKSAIPAFVNPVFKESVAQGGRIFSDVHSYFKVPKKYKKKLRAISKKLKSQWLK